MITTSLEISKRLKEAGFPQNSLLSFWKCDYRDPEILLSSYDAGDAPMCIVCSAPTAEEILEKLPNNLVIEVNSYDGLCKNYQVIAENRRGIELPKGIICHAENNKNLADALALMWLYLKEHNLL